MADLPLHVVRVVAPEIDATAPSRKQFAVLESSPSITWSLTTLSGSINNSTLNFTANPNNNETFFNRRAYLRVKGTITFNGNSGLAGRALIQASGMANTGFVQPVVILPPAPSGTQMLDAPRAWPLANAMNTAQVTMAGDNINVSLNRYARWLSRYNTGLEFQQTTGSMTPTMLDQSKEYADLSGTARDPLNDYAHNPIQDPRGGFVGCLITRNDNTGAADVATVDFDFIEPVQLSPFLYEQGEYSTGLVGFSTLSFQFTLGGLGNGANSGLPAAIWSHSNAIVGGFASTITSSSVQLTEATMLISQANPSERIPMSNFWPWNDIKVYPTSTQNAVGPQLFSTMSQNTISLDCIPQRVYVVVNPDSQNYNISTADAPKFQITQAKVYFANNSVALSDASPQDLYQISVRNGCSLSWTQWSKQIGSVLCLEFGRDIPLGNDLFAPGLALKANFRVDVQIFNLSPIGSAPIVPELNVFMVYGGLVKSEQGRVSHSYGYLEERDVIMSKALPQMPLHMVKSVYGAGGFWSDLGQSLSNFARKVGRPVLDIARKVVPQFYPAAAPVLEGVSNVAQSLGYGCGPMGGKKMTKAQLRRLLK